MRIKILEILCISLLLSFNLMAEVKMPGIFTDNMVLQRDEPLLVWGWADNNEQVSVNFNGQKRVVRASISGKWEVELNAMPPGGPFEMTIKGKNKIITYRNIMLGDVWMCSGQSNMEFILKRCYQADQEISESNYPDIRFFTVTRTLNNRPSDDLTGEWQVCSPQTSPDFSAVAYFFGRYLNRELHIPIGLIHSSWGGVSVETWTSTETMQKTSGYEQVIANQTTAEYDQIVAQNLEQKRKFDTAVENDPGILEKWYDSAEITPTWKGIYVPGTWENTDLGTIDGTVWYRTMVDIGNRGNHAMALLNLGHIDDYNETWVNGHLVGTGDELSPNTFSFPVGLLQEGKNLVAVRVTDKGGDGGIYGVDGEAYLQIGERRYSLNGEWRYRIGTACGPRESAHVSPAAPTMLYNAMIHPVIRYKIKGAIFYQGEHNAGAAYRYRTLFPNMINDWRDKWGYEFPFLWVQLANYMQPVAGPSESDWAELREAQTMTLSLPKTGQAVTIDIGDANDIHPRNKQDVGLRLGLSAMKVAYGRKITHSGPVYKSMEIAGNEIILTFDHVGSGLIAQDKYNYPKGFTIAGADKKFVWAKARIEGNRVIVFNENIENPVAVRYAWANNPDDANLYNKENLPASPFRTDGWPGITAH